MKQKLGIFIILSALITQPLSAQAATRAEMLIQINQLLQQIEYLQSLIAQREAVNYSQSQSQRSHETRYATADSEYYTGTYTGIYYVYNARLSFADGTNYTTHQQLWDLFVETVGKEAADTYIDEFRVFHDDESDLGAFVETKTTINDKKRWILAINSFDYDMADSVNHHLYQELLVHEFAHILMFEFPDLASDFKEEFWNRTDLRHASRVANADREDVEALLENYYQSNKDEYVSDYATYSPDEDLAETFAEFVMSEKPHHAETEVEDKIVYLYMYPELVDYRETIRSNLGLDD